MSDKKGISDMIKGTASRTKGQVQDQVGRAIGNQEMQHKGKQDKLKGAKQQDVGENIEDPEKKRP